MNNINIKLDNFLKHICLLIKQQEHKFYKRTYNDMSKRITLMDFIFFGSSYIYGKSYVHALSTLEHELDKTFSKQSMNNRRNTFDLSILEEINDGIVKYIVDEYRNEKGKNITISYCNDGANVNLSINLKKDNFKVSKTNDYCSANISNLYCQTLNTPINYFLSNGQIDERTMFKEHFRYT